MSYLTERNVSWPKITRMETNLPICPCRICMSCTLTKCFSAFNETELKLAYKNCRFSLLIPVEVNLKRKIKQKE